MQDMQTFFAQLRMYIKYNLRIASLGRVRMRSVKNVCMLVGV